ncbi:carboxypeptidase-like regulatory domain-containing protein [Pedobacter frigoris]|uniref:carboxypeptidase-like regulatory domain-containing protein n=1 Tax=Pedobacter frigoris TaxID=2571272 RepID=UPI00292D4BC8|nr:carboxypeptidase-like regulatory domain-containing protein [Pedobacter frigoris]
MNKDWLDIAVLEDYLDGKLDAKTMHRVEREALEDPFVAEALAGLSESPKRSLNSISILQKQLQERIAEQHVIKKRSVITWQRLSIAATAAVMFIAVSVVFWMKEDNRRKQMAALPKKVDVTIAQKKTEVPVQPSIAADEAPVAIEKAIQSVNKESYAGLKAKKTPVVDPVKGGGAALNDAVVMAAPDVPAKQPASAAPLMLRGVSAMNLGGNNSLSGTVVEQDNGEPIRGVNIKVAGTNLNAVTDAYGKFTINSDTVIKGNIIANYIGYKPAEAKLNANQPVNLSLVADKSILNEVVVVGYGSQPKAKSVGSIVTITGKDIKAVPNEDLAKLLQGKVAGFTNTTDPSSISNVMIRGRSADAPKYTLSEPSGGWEKFTVYIKKNNRFRNEAKIGQTVILTFTLSKKGKPENIKILKGIAEKYDQEAIRLILKGPKWDPSANDVAQLIAAVDF